MRQSIIATLLLFSSINLIGQPYFNWAQGYDSGSGNEEVAIDVHWTEDDGILSTGTFEGDISFGDSTIFYHVSGGSTDIYLLKQDDSGNTLWTKSWGGPGEELVRTISSDDDGNIYLIGSFSDTLIAGEDTLVSRGFLDAFVLKLDMEGNHIWSFHLGGDFDDKGMDVELDNRQRPVITFEHKVVSYFFDGIEMDTLLSNGQRDIGLMKLTREGAVMWERSIGNEGGNDKAKRIVIDSLGNIFAYGSFRDTVDFDPGSGVAERAALGRDIYLLKLDSLGDFKWVKRIGRGSEDAPEEITLSGQDIYFTGAFKGDIGPHNTSEDTILFSNGHYDVYILKMTISGQFLWGRAMGDLIYDSGLDITTDPAGNVYTSGIFTGQIDLDPGPDTLLALGTPSRRAMFLQKLDSDGNLVYASEFLGEADGYMQALDVREDGAIVMTGRFKGSTDMAPFDDEYILETGLGASDVFTARFNQCLINSESIMAEACGNYDWNGIVYDSSGVYIQEFQNIGGCDSIVELTLTILEESQQELTLSACDSIVINETTYALSGSYSQVLMNQVGCDSTLNLELDIAHTSLTELDFISCSEFELNGISYLETGIYQQVYETQEGCDSILIIDLLIPVLDTSVLVEPPFLASNALEVDYQWLDCDDGYSSVLGANAAEFQATQNGAYAVEISIESCVDTSACYLIDGVGLEEYGNHTLDLFPNPASTSINITLPYEAIKLTIYDSSGRESLKIEERFIQTTIDLSRFERGVYFVEVLTSRGRHAARRLLIQ